MKETMTYLRWHAWITVGHQFKHCNDPRKLISFTWDDPLYKKQDFTEEKFAERDAKLKKAGFIKQ